jgi:hypothetical protein
MSFYFFLRKEIKISHCIYGFGVQLSETIPQQNDFNMILLYAWCITGPYISQFRKQGWKAEKGGVFKWACCWLV